MKKKIILFLLIQSVAISMYGCKPNEKEAVTETVNTTAEDTANTAVKDTFSFEKLKNLQFYFSSGAGAWATTLVIRSDGSFCGEYHDSDAGDTGEEYPNGTVYKCNFSGQFTQPVKVNDYTYSVKISKLSYENEVGTKEIKDGMLFSYENAYGLYDAENILIYTPDTPLSELSEDFKSWIMLDTEKLPFYALNNEINQQGFSSFSIIDNLTEYMASVENSANSLETYIHNDAISQSELNQKTEELYNLWDNALNEVWSVLKQTLDEKSFESLTAEEREWINNKEKKVAEVGSEQPAVMNEKSAELTKTRVYELLELLVPSS